MGDQSLSDQIQLVVGLGNPGSGYEQTRHNAGFWFIDELAARLGVELHEEKRFHGLVGSTDIAGQRVYLLKPTTFMNRSGRSVIALSQFYHIPIEHILVVHDELDLEVGTLRIKCGGGHGGHNGLRDIINASGGSADFTRLRLGIGHPGDPARVVDYVLKRPSAEERQHIDGAIAAALEQLPILVEGDIQHAQNQLHRR